MPPLPHPLALLARAPHHQLVKRKNWAAREPGVVLVFCIVFIVALLLVSLFIQRKLTARRELREKSEGRR
ncbi:uncharacterized protein K452DRAFT_287394 [Aplosporella prunicola CBS 121167]|uniref:Uncharacterized protein n=1 Tax=Aplosporella prunicola CBS 121167 TaxID=1176127 RepID=A0A6A6BFU3_9PEZI|nr:uncharacterized protein K452DRAFT_287394 [Aplosporella prunicola CBS 121167]KAF2142175.1 hypothetical protein K452DRAFT_287394 [Aplosporella prunicola CBS 121167]